MGVSRNKARTPAPAVTAVAAAEPAPQAATPAAAGITIGFIAGLDHDGCPRVIVPGGDDVPLRARSLCPVQASERGRQCALMFENADPRQPLILGLLQHPVLSLYSPSGDVSVQRNGEELCCRPNPRSSCAAAMRRCGSPPTAAWSCAAPP